MQNNITVTKKISELYEVRQANGSCGKWADFNLVCGAESVRISINSDYGNYAYVWGSCGCNPKEFLTDIDFYYAMKNLSNYNLYVDNVNGFTHHYKRDLIQLVHDGVLTFNRAKEIYFELKEFTGSTNREIQDQLFESDLAKEIGYNDPSCIPNPRMIDPILVMFWDNCWIPFVEQLKTELSQKTI
ncbi:hypothetical protein [Photobacterium damselae]|uniref:hypothetical protein n=1 Tax=Photobacterium damselae TaxID=38293 RepID=UPI001F3DFC6B|nr:hypothetical protein [Photobacterium damselae]UKA04853.1 hypothetical protein IHC89_21660 [Photobacterium damselae subsp. damselae]